MNDPDGLFFLLREGRHAGVGAAADRAVWLVEVDTRRRAVRSVARYSKEETTGMSRLAFRDDDDDDLASVSMFHGLAFLPSEVSKYPSYTSGDPAVRIRPQINHTKLDEHTRRLLLSPHASNFFSLFLFSWLQA
jgi:hypothetical protein